MSAARQVYEFYVAQGLSPVQAAGLTGRFMQESSPGLNVGLVGDDGTAFGLAQWRGDRWAQVQNYMRANGLNPQDRMSHARAALWELQNREKTAWQMLQNAKTLPEAMNAATAFERPRGYTRGAPQNAHGYQRSMSYAAGLLGDGTPGSSEYGVIQASNQAAAPVAADGPVPGQSSPPAVPGQPATPAQRLQALGNQGMSYLEKQGQQEEARAAQFNQQIQQQAVAAAQDSGFVEQPRFQPLGQQRRRYGWQSA